MEELPVHSLVFVMSSGWVTVAERETERSSNERVAATTAIVTRGGWSCTYLSRLFQDLAMPGTQE